MGTDPDWMMHVYYNCQCILPQVSRYPRCIKRINGYVHKTYAYGSPEIVRKIFTGKLTPSYFNDVCYGRKQTPQEFRFDTPIERVKPLWEPKQVPRDTKRHVLQKIEDARYRKQSMLEKASIKKEKERMRRSEAALLRESEQMSRGVTAYLVKLERQKQKYDAKIAARKEKRKSIVE